MSPLAFISGGCGRLPILVSTTPTIAKSARRFSTSFASLASPQSPPPQPKSKSNATSSNTPFVVVDSSPKTPQDSSNYALANPNGTIPDTQFARSTESDIEKVIFDFRFLALLAVAGSLAGSLLCFLDGCVYIMDAYKIYWTSCMKGVLSGKMVMRLVEAIDVYLAGTVMLIFAMGLYGLFISNTPDNIAPADDRALKGSSLFGMFALRERPKWMKISSLDELKTKVGHVIVMILLVKMFEKSKMVTITTGLDLLSYSVCIFLSSASLYILHNLHKDDHK
ncbi:Golgi apparatus membrane protein [Tanacetum coccineum]